MSMVCNIARKKLSLLKERQKAYQGISRMFGISWQCEDVNRCDIPWNEEELIDQLWHGLYNDMNVLLPTIVKPPNYKQNY